MSNTDGESAARSRALPAQVSSAVKNQQRRDVVEGGAVTGLNRCSMLRADVIAAV
jgi:hypothetical protein